MMWIRILGDLLSIFLPELVIFLTHLILTWFYPTGYKMPHEDYVYLAKLAEQAERYEGQLMSYLILFES